ncbi:MAG: hypothetical protein DRH26_03490 [Deltaproteobacteria bacterium]|nr:MAG: hypothetical protein DRH26_03490 [Deltaproteobacteria bacterium]
MPVQTSYTAEQVAAFEGQRANLGLTNITSKAAQAGDIPFGRAVVRGTADNQAKLPTAGSQGFLGITEMTTAWSENASDLHLYEQYREMNIIDFGLIWVYTEQSVVPGNAVYFRHTADTAPLDILGRFRKDTSGGDAELITGASFESTTAAGGIALVNLNTPGVGVLLSPDSSETITATTAVVGVDTEITYVDTTLGAMAASLADGTEGQNKKIMMTVDGGDCIITPANLAIGATLRLTDVFSSYTLQFSGTSWKVIAREGKSIVTITAATTAAMPLDVEIFIFDSTIGASTGAIAAGYPGQEVTMKMLVDGGDQVITPAVFLDGTIITFDNSDAAVILSDGTNWLSVGTPTAAIS